MKKQTIRLVVSKSKHSIAPVIKAVSSAVIGATSDTITIKGTKQ